jgi:hypothetical protein
MTTRAIPVIVIAWTCQNAIVSTDNRLFQGIRPSLPIVNNACARCAKDTEMTRTMQTAKQITKRISHISSIVLVAIFVALFAIGLLAKFDLLP